MKEFEEKLKKYIRENKIAAEHLAFTQSCHSVSEAALACGATPEDFVKNICMIDEENNLIVAIVKGEDRASRTKVGKALGINMPKVANEDEILKYTGYPCGGVPSFGYKASFVIDPRVMEKEIVYTGGGSTHSLVRIKSSDLKKANGGAVISIRK
ncbi:Cys-tRNA(Pro)/Cys-tRNA(Cys) deacylase YbaK [Oxobacter pfennigii]|uniref:Cys-tRNA(Pro)/Cys-tRNA(Cys) deacylase YbaK n=1 Tax=Oxobacter pfennigii TaxID=36849 RepID=A0A0P8W412_9CLOT|nr:YbaK/EbsC family protein [Oxobacter pfennigii]KPU42353.1 Cys-tRNA(Pro)/Cys-tRNA(Cys) deacylase YbaK [Oxobacter pfennigii]